MTLSSTSPLPRTSLAVAVLGVFVLIFSASLAGINQLGEVAPFWPGVGFSFGMLAIAPRRQLPAFAGIVFAAALATNVIFGYAPRPSVSFALINALEPALGVWLWRRLSSERTDLRSALSVLTMTLAAGVGAALAAVPGAWLMMGILPDGAPFGALWRSWMLVDFIGVCVVAPVIICWRPGARLRPARWGELALILVAMVAVAVAIFQQPLEQQVQALSWGLPVLLWAALRTGQPGTTAAGLVLTVVAVGFTVSGQGPLQEQGRSLAAQAFALQLFLAWNLIPFLVLAGVTSQRDRSSALLRQRERQYSRILESTREGVCETDAQLRITYVNRRLAELLGCSPGGLVGRPLQALIDPSQHDLLDDRQRSAHQEVILRRAGGAAVHAEMVLDPITGLDGAHQGLVALVRDVTEQRAQSQRQQVLEQQLHQTRKLEALGMLAGGIAHDFNNLLTVILFNAEFLEDILSGDALESVEEIRTATERGSALTAQLLAFGRKQVLQLRPINLAAQVQQATAMIQRVIGEDITVVSDIAEERLLVNADGNQLDQVLLNLAVNARDAMSDGGRLTISLAPLGEALACLSIADTGGGIPDDVLPHIFEPFFTTKPVGEGTGLGLSMIHGIVDQHGGEIQVQTTSGQGTRFDIILPRWTNAPSQSSTLSPDRLQTRLEGVRVLLVEDEGQILHLARRVLSSAGMEVVSLQRSTDALAQVAAGEQFDLLISDVIMPELSGGELHQKIQAHLPELPALFISGYPRSFLDRHGRLEEGIALLTKPFTAQELLRRVHGCLHTPDTQQVS